MDIVIQIVVKVAEYAVEPAIGQVGYLAHCKRNLENLQTQVNELSATREALELEVVRAEEKGEEIQTDVQNWLKDVVEITEKASKLWKRDTQAKMSCLHGVCPNPVLRYKLGRRSTKLQLAVFNLYAKRDFASISYNVRPQEVSMVFDKHYEAFDLRTLTVKKIMDELRIPNTDLILVYGIGGLGKTTLVEEVHRQAVKAKLFADAVMVRSVQNPDLQGIQKEIAIKLGMEVQESETMSVRALRLCNRIKDTKVLVILDNISESIDLQSVGLPCLPNCRILLTSRTRKLLSSEKRSQKDFALQVLNEEDAWSLYETKAGDVKNPGIRIVATDVAKKCGGLPLLVVTVASSSRNRSTLPVSKDALRCLKVFDNEDSAEQEAYSALEWTYNQLDDQKLKPLFLICGILLPTGCELDHGLDMLKRSCEDLYLDGSEGTDNVVYHSGSEDFQKLKRLHVKNNAQFTHIIAVEVVLRNLTSLVVDDFTGLTFALLSSMARNLVQLKKLEITGCESMEEIGPVKGSMKQRLHPGMLSSQDHATAHYSAFTGLKVTEDGIKPIQIQLATSQISELVFVPCMTAVKACDMWSGKTFLKFRGHYEHVNCCWFSSQDQELYTGGNDRQILVWSLPRMVSDEDKGPSKDGDNWSN
ncbi:hypothetical protein TB1_042329 [Malus domestica]